MFYMVEKINSVEIESTNGSDTVITELNKRFNWNLAKTEDNYKTKFGNLFKALSKNTSPIVKINAVINPNLNQIVTFEPVTFEVPATGSTLCVTTSSEYLPIKAFSPPNTSVNNIWITSIQEGSNRNDIRFYVKTDNFSGSCTVQLRYATEKYRSNAQNITLKLQS